MIMYAYATAINGKVSVESIIANAYKVWRLYKTLDINAQSIDIFVTKSEAKAIVKSLLNHAGKTFGETLLKKCSKSDLPKIKLPFKWCDYITFNLPGLPFKLNVFTLP